MFIKLLIFITHSFTHTCTHVTTTIIHTISENKDSYTKRCFLAALEVTELSCYSGGL